MTLVDIALLNAALAERDAAREENARLRAAVEAVLQSEDAGWYDIVGDETRIDLSYDAIRAALAVPTADDGAERGAR